MEVRIASPCTEKWESMTGNERVRHCASCRLNVYDVKELTEDEVRALFVKNEGRVCGRIFTRADGTVLTKDCPTGVALLRRKALAALTMAATLVLAMVGFGMFRGKKSCATDPSAGWFDRVVGTRAVEAREGLRETKALGPVINELFPPAPRMMAGKMAIRTPPALPTAAP